MVGAGVRAGTVFLHAVAVSFVRAHDVQSLSLHASLEPD